MRVKEQDLRYALSRSPTRNWGSTLRSAWSEIKDGTLASYNGVMVVNDSVWHSAMKSIHALPAGGRWVAAERKEMCLWLRKATDFN